MCALRLAMECQVEVGIKASSLAVSLSRTQPKRKMNFLITALCITLANAQLTPCSASTLGQECYCVSDRATSCNLPEANAYFSNLGAMGSSGPVGFGSAARAS